jgi:hypothetical protein
MNTPPDEGVVAHLLLCAPHVRECGLHCVVDLVEILTVSLHTSTRTSTLLNLHLHELTYLIDHPILGGLPIRHELVHAVQQRLRGLHLRECEVVALQECLHSVVGVEELQCMWEALGYHS